MRAIGIRNVMVGLWLAGLLAAFSWVATRVGVLEFLGWWFGVSAAAFIFMLLARRREDSST